MYTHSLPGRGMGGRAGGAMGGAWGAAGGMRGGLLVLPPLLVVSEGEIPDLTLSGCKCKGCVCVCVWCEREGFIHYIIMTSYHHDNIATSHTLIALGLKLVGANLWGINHQWLLVVNGAVGERR